MGAIPLLQMSLSLPVSIPLPPESVLLLLQAAFTYAAVTSATAAVTANTMGAAGACACISSDISNSSASGGLPGPRATEGGGQSRRLSYRDPPASEAAAGPARQLWNIAASQACVSETTPPGQTDHLTVRFYEDT